VFWAADGKCVSQQYRSEIEPFLEIVKARGAKTALEIGSGYFGTSILLLRAMGEGALLVSVDLPESNGGPSLRSEREAREVLA
jgi:predicted O-methyltransferase YrrM